MKKIKVTIKKPKKMKVILNKVAKPKNLKKVA